MNPKDFLKYFVEKSGKKETSVASNLIWFPESEFGEYAYSETAGLHMNDLLERDKLNIDLITVIIARIIETSRNNLRAIWLVKEDAVPTTKRGRIFYIEDYENYRITHSNKPEKLIECIENKIQFSPFQTVQLDENDMRLCEIINEHELNYWLKHLIEDKLISNPVGDFVAKYKKGENELKFISPFHHEFTLTSKAWTGIEQKRKGKNSKLAFIAMSFGINERLEIQNAIEEACRKVGYEAKTVDQVEFNGKITDKIYAMIKESAFVIADFTDNNHGVYFEAGYAEGMGRPVISTIKEGQVKTLHFDTAQTRHTLWKDPEHLKEQLIDRIKATIL